MQGTERILRWGDPYIETSPVTGADSFYGIRVLLVSKASQSLTSDKNVSNPPPFPRPLDIPRVCKRQCPPCDFKGNLYPLLALKICQGLNLCLGQMRLGALWREKQRQISPLSGHRYTLACEAREPQRYTLSCSFKGKK